MSTFKLLKRKLELETELDAINAKLKAAAAPNTSELIKVKGLELNVRWVAPTMRFDRKGFEAANPRLVNRLREFCSTTKGYHTVGKVKEVS